MSMNNFNYKPRKTRIARISNDDEIIVECIAEDLQDEYERVQDLHNEVLDIEEKISDGMKNPPSDQIKALVQKSMERDKARLAFWENVCNRYNAWYMDMSIKDGYALVRSGDNDFNKMLRRLRG